MAEVAHPTFTDLISPLALVSALPWMILFAWVARRLLGLGPGRWSSSVLAGLTGWLGCGAVTLLVVRRTTNSGTLFVVSVATAIVFTMLAVVGLELTSRRRPAATSGGIPHPIRGLKDRVARARRYAPVVRIAARHGLRMRGERDGSRLPARQVRLALDEAGCMFVKLGQMLAGRPDVVGSVMAEELGHLREDVSP